VEHGRLQVRKLAEQPHSEVGDDDRDVDDRGKRRVRRPSESGSTPRVSHLGQDRATDRDIFRLGMSRTERAWR